MSNLNLQSDPFETVVSTRSFVMMTARAHISNVVMSDKQH